MSKILDNSRLKAKERLLIPKDSQGFSPDSGDIKLALSYPNRYWVAMSNLGFQAVYKLFASQKRISVERAFMPDESFDSSKPDSSGASAGSLIKSFEKSNPLSSFDILAVSVSFETDYLSVLEMLDAGGCLNKDLLTKNLTESEIKEKVEEAQQSNSFLLPKSFLTKKEDLKETGHFRPLTIAGGAAITLNPEPLASFFDVIVIGEAEELIPEISEIYVEARDSGKSFSELLVSLSEVSGVYVPSLTGVSYNENNEIKEFTNLGHKTFPVQRRFVKNISAFPTTTVIQTPETEFKSMYMTETGRGCEVGCKFCVAGYMYRPVRKRSADSIRDALKVTLEDSRDDKNSADKTIPSVGFVGAAVSSHPEISELASEVATSGRRAALSSIMSQRVTGNLAESLSESEYKTVALAPEAGSEELRFKIGKRVCDEQIVEGVRTLAKNGIRNFKLYFIIALPGEEVSDILKIVELVRLLKDEALKAARENNNFIAPKIILSVNPFIPKAWTPFQRHGFMEMDEIKKRVSLVKSAVKKMPNVTMKHESPRESFFQAVLSRGDRRVGASLMYLKMAGHDWKWLVKNSKKELIPGVPAANFYANRQMTKTEVLPWEILDFGIKRSLLDREYDSTFKKDFLPIIARAKAKNLSSVMSIRDGVS